MIRSFHHSQYGVDRLFEEKRDTVTVVLPAREVADTVGVIVERVRSLEPLIDKVLVVDAGYDDGTAEVADTVGVIVERLQGLAPLIDQVLVVDAGSRDGTAELAAASGAEVYQESELLTEFGPVLGKGDAMWRALSVVRGELVVYLDSDTADFSPHFATGLLGPLMCEPEVSFVKAHYRRPFSTPDGVEQETGGGLVNELTARPLLSAFFP